jgi:hypothetical protein
VTIETSKPLTITPPLFPYVLHIKNMSFSTFQWPVPKFCSQECQSVDLHWELNAQRRDNLDYILIFISAFKFPNSIIKYTSRKYMRMDLIAGFGEQKSDKSYEQE